MSSWKLDSDGDLLVVNNKLSLTIGRDAIRQHIQTSLRLFLGEWFLDTTLGVPYYQEIFVKQQTQETVASIMKRAISRVPGFISFLTFNFDYNRDTREFFVSFSVETVEGIIDFEEFLEVFS
jgi:hypothetical protein